MGFAPLPETAAWRHQEARTGFEVAYFHLLGDGCRIEGWTTAVEDGKTWAVEYTIDLDGTGATRNARLRGRSAGGLFSTLLQADGAGRWQVDGVPAPHLDGCLDVDLESSAMTNALPVRRMRLAPGAGEGTRQRYDYAAPAFDFTCRLSYDESGLVLDYPGIAVRAG